ncbi:hypothetical protein V6N13_146485 [Hibiscus sabdariffa]|uniref:Gnk2-homologous domain-containing protein n=1 Tax=Hibiscus sabdariffa TaxID=183260 RepID=A0ABR2TSU2_9ROSI
MFGSLQSHSTHRTIFFLLLSLSCFSHLVGSNIFIYGGCSQDKYARSTPFEVNLNSFLSSVVSSSSQVSYNTYAIGNGSSTPPEATLFGLYQCRGDLQMADCTRCMQSAVNQIRWVCPYSNGASLQLEGCYMRYDHNNFLGVPDTSLKFKKCSKSVNKDVEFFERRDDVLDDLESAIGFKVSSSGMVQGSAQCLGDLSATDCSSCLAVAVRELKSLCGSAEAAGVFLGQCYARYWASGYYAELSPDSPHGDDMGRTIAIIVGVLGGLALLVVLLSICRKSSH